MPQVAPFFAKSILGPPHPMPPPSKKRTLKASESRVQDPDGVRRDILAVATSEFAEKGYSGARVDEIAARTRTSKRMIYYYFGDKQGLFIAVLEAAYASIRAIEAQLDLARLAPVAALRKLAEFTFTYQNAHPEFVRLVIIENIHGGEHLARSSIIQQLNVSVLHVLGDIYERGVAEGVFRPGVDIIDIHMTISALSIFNVSNRATFSLIFKREMGSKKALAKRCAVAGDTAVRYVCKPGAAD
jgi:AcrR family transcriptional regulator